MTALAQSDDVKIMPEIDFYLGTSFSVMQLEDDLHELELQIRDLRSAHAGKRAVSMKLCADDVAKKCTQIAALARVVSNVTEVHVNRKPRNGSAA